MATFTPPTHTEYFAPAGVDRLWSRVPYQRGNAVLVDEDGNITAYPGLTVVDSDQLIAAQTNGVAALGGTTVTVSDLETELLIAGAGYELEFIDEDLVGLDDGLWPGVID